MNKMKYDKFYLSKFLDCRLKVFDFPATQLNKGSYNCSTYYRQLLKILLT